MTNTENIRLWVDTLRSGRFNQGNSALEITYPNGTVAHCCLGVACRVAMENGLDLPNCQYENSYGNGEKKTAFGRDPNVGYLPIEVRDWFGFSNTDPTISDTLTAVEANDEKRYTFNEIAYLIETRYLND